MSTDVENTDNEADWLPWYRTFKMFAPRAGDQLVAKHRHNTSQAGFPVNLLISALQKYIRRGELKKAVWCALELDGFSALEDPAALQAYMAAHPDHEPMKQVKAVRTQMMNRLNIISVEDVGLADPVVRVVKPLLDRWDESGRTDTVSLVRAVGILCKARKLRFLSDLKSVFHLPKYYGSTPEEEARIVDAIRELRRVHDVAPHGDPRLAELFARFEELSTIYNVPEKNKKKIIGPKHPIWELTRTPEIDALHELFKRCDSEEHPLFLYQAIVLECFKPRLETTAEVLSRLDVDAAALIAELRPMAIRCIDDYCHDRHVVRGSTSVTQFALVGAMVANEAPHPCPSFRQVYIDLKRFIDAKAPKTRKASETRKRKASPETKASPKTRKAAKAPCAVEGSESDLLRFLVRAQVLTSAGKADTYFATLRRPFKGFEADDCVLVKGPLKEEEAQNALRMNQWKQRQGFPVLRMVDAQLALDRWPEGTPLGARNKMDRDCAFFLLTESTVPSAALARTTYKAYKGKEWKDTLVWPAETEIVDWHQVASHIEFKKKGKTEGYDVSPSQMVEYVLLLLARWLFGISDLADRNFILREGHVYSIDEEYLDRPVNFKTELKGSKCAFVGQWVADNYAALHGKIAAWDVPAELRERHAQLLDRDRCVALF